jgi:hypothetical protein
MTIKNYLRAVRALNKYYDGEIKKAKKRDSRLDSRGLRVPMTPAGLRAELREIEGRRARSLAWVNMCNDAPAFDLLLVNVEWVKNRTWGNNPRADVSIYSTDGNAERATGRASGCGYDKRSAAVDAALRTSAVFGRLLIENWRRVADCYGVEMWRGFPALDISGKGIETLRTVCERCGLIWRSNTSGKNWDTYEAARKGGKNGR